MRPPAGTASEDAVASLTQKFDMVVLGSGAAGFAAAVTGAARGLRVLMLEKAEVFGGTSAISGGAVWIVGSDQAQAEGVIDSPARARDYLRQLLGPGYRPAVVDAYLERGAEALRFLENNSDLHYLLRPFSPDYHPGLEGGTDRGRALEIAEYDGRKLGEHFTQLRRPPDGMLLFGGMMVNRVDIQHFLSLRRSLRSLWHCARLLARYGVDRLRYPRGTRLTVGNALIARLATTAFAKGVQLWLGARTESLLVEHGKVGGVVVEHEQRRIRIEAAAVVLAAGGYAASPDAGKDRPDPATTHWTMSQQDSIGSSRALASTVDAAVGEHLVSNFFWAPISVLTRADGRLERFPHLVTDRAKPGVIAINRQAKRFVNEAESYHQFVTAMYADPQHNAPCWLVCDARAMDAYGMGLARPRPVDNQALIKAGYLHRAASLPALAAQLGLDTDALQATVATFNRDAALGRDTQYGKGGTSYNRSLGDPYWQPNPCLAPLQRAPFYAVRIDAGDMGSARGLVTDGNARVLDRAGTAIDGLYAAGNDMNSVVEGSYPGPGTTLGPALTFGYLAATDIAARLQTASATSPPDQGVTTCSTKSAPTP